MFLMIYARLRLLYFCLGTILQEDSGGGSANPGAALALMLRQASWRH